MTTASKELQPAVDDESSIFSMVYAALKKIGIVGAIYFVGYMGWSVAWLITPVIFSVMRDQWKKASETKRNISVAFATASEKDIILSKITDLPAWVSYLYCLMIAFLKINLNRFFLLL